MSSTLMDERFRRNRERAQLVAMKLAAIPVVVSLFVVCRGALFGSLDYTLIAVTILLALSVALATFLEEYLLYKFDHDEQLEE